METSYNYTCPNCSMECSVSADLAAHNVVCPHCSQEFYATPPETSPEVALPEKLPFFKFGRRKILEEKVQQLVADGEMSDLDEQSLTAMAKQLRLDESELSKLVKRDFLNEFSVIQRRVEKTFQLTDEDLEQIEALKRKYGVKNVAMEGNAEVFRQIYLVETVGQRPIPIHSDLMLDGKEEAFHSVSSTWQQVRVHNRGYAGTSVSVPTGIKGVRFRFDEHCRMKMDLLSSLGVRRKFQSPDYRVGTRSRLPFNVRALCCVRSNCLENITRNGAAAGLV